MLSYPTRVDRVDQRLHNIQVLRKSCKWYCNLAFCLSIKMILNAHNVYAHDTLSSISFMDFVLEVVKLLVTKAPPPPTIIRGPPEENYVRLRHFPMLKKASATASNKHPTKVCKVCYAQGKSTTRDLPLRTSYVCGDCPSQPGLHVEYQGQYCFKIYHTELNFGSSDNHD